MKIIDEWRQEDYENGKKEGKEEEKINTAKNMLKENYTIKQIATFSILLLNFSMNYYISSYSSRKKFRLSK